MCTGEHANRIHDGLSSTRTRQGLHNQRITGSNLSHDVLLLTVGIQEQGVRCGGTFVLAHNHGVFVLIGQAGACGDIAGKRIQDGVGQVANISDHGSGKI